MVKKRKLTLRLDRLNNFQITMTRYLALLALGACGTLPENTVGPIRPTGSQPPTSASPRPNSSALPGTNTSTPNTTGSVASQLSAASIAQPQQEVSATLELDQPSQNTVFLNRLDLSLAANEVGGRILKFNGCIIPNIQDLPPELSVKLYSMQTFKTLKPSYVGAIPGNYYDPLIPYSGGCLKDFVFADITVEKNAKPQVLTFKINDLPVVITVNSFSMPERPTIPMYMGLSTYSILRAHNFPNSSSLEVQVPLAEKYIDLLRSHRIEPYGHSILVPGIKNGQLDLSETLMGSFTSTHLTNALAGLYMIQYSGPRQQNPEYLSAVEVTLKSNTAFQGAWHYVKDEPREEEIAATYDLAAMSKRYAPTLETVVTAVPHEKLMSVVDHFVVPIQHFKVPGYFSDYSRAPNYWLYGACPSHGSCDNKLLRDRDGTPDLMIDEPTIHSRMFPVLFAHMRAKAGLYYMTNYIYGRGGDPWVDQFYFGGNGDGQLIYPAVAGSRGFTQNDALPSLRMKLIRQGMYDSEYLLKSGAQNPNLIKDQFNWTKNHADLDSLRRAYQAK